MDDMRECRVQTSFAAGKEKFTSIELNAPFATAVVDPDWPYTVSPGKTSVSEIEDAEAKGRLSGFTRNRDLTQNQYKQSKPLSVEQLKTLPVGELVGGYLLMWTVGPFLINGTATSIMEAWGFQPASILTWAKYDLKNAHGYGGVGFWFLGNAEFCIVGKREGWPSIRTGRSSLMVEPKTGHSIKPDRVHELCEQRFPGPYLEIFGRRSRPSWTVLGNEAPGDGLDVIESMAHLRALLGC